MTFEELAKENAGREATDQEFAQGIGIYFYVDLETEMVHHHQGDPEPATNIEICLWDQLRHAYGFTAKGTVNSLHEAQFDRENNTQFVSN